jgi:hypothetical protein
MVNEKCTIAVDLPIRTIVMRHDGGGGRASRAELLIGIMLMEGR